VSGASLCVAVLQAAVQHQLASLALAIGDLAGAIEANQEAARLARHASDALTETSALYYRGLLELRAGNLRVYYAVEGVPSPTVLIVAVGIKVRERLRIGGKDVEP